MKLFKLLLPFALLTSIGCSSIVYAQSFPVTRTAAWDANAPEDVVTEYLLKIDNGEAIHVASSSIDAACNCYKVPFTITVAGVHTIKVSAVNEFGESADASATINVQLARVVKGVRITK